MLSGLDLLLLAALGLLGGAGAGFLGIGGSVVMIPGMVLLFGPDRQHLYQAAAMIVNFFTIAPAVVRHYQAGATLRSVVRWTIPSAVVGAVAGVFISDLPVFRGSGQGYLQIGFATFLLYVVVHNLWTLWSGLRMPALDRHRPRRSSRLLTVLLVGLPAGLLAGILGIGGGLVAVPMQQVALRIRLPNAIANSATTILYSSIVGAMVKNYTLTQHGFHVGDSLLLAACLTPSAMIGSWFAAAKVHQWPVFVIRIVFAVMLTYAAAKLLLTGWGQVQL
ncbi:MAG TPA: sulfite exporter TauE/SafE family protein [Phycisphaerae bacterium]|nr:sulfite exporter TauE/SafE family protein [Phycisphaerae bacterium]